MSSDGRGGIVRRRQGMRVVEIESKTTRMFLGFCRPPLAHAAQRLIDAHRREGLLDLDEVVIVTPGARAGRTLLALLVEAAEAADLELAPPRLCTPGSLAEEVCAFDQPLAGSVAQRLAWVEALRQTPAEVLSPLVAQPPPPDSAAGWQGFAAILERLHADLAAEKLRMHDVAEKLRTTAWFDEGQQADEAARWDAAAAVQRSYEQTLAQWGLADPHLARIGAAASEESIELDVALVGVVEMPAVLREVLKRCRSVASFVFAPESLAGGFDEIGCVDIDFWKERDIALDAGDIYFADDPHGQADLALAALAEVGPTRSTNDVTIGAADPSIEAALAERIELEAHLPVHRAAGRSIVQTPPYRVLAACADYLDDLRFEAFAALARQADVEALGRRLAKESGARPATVPWAEALDDFQARCLPLRMDGRRFGSVYPEVRAALDEAERAVQALLGDLAERETDGTGARRSQPAWAAPIRALLQRLYDGRTANRDVPADRRLIQALEQIGSMLEEWQRFERRAGAALPACTASEALRFLLEQLEGAALADEPDSRALEMLGWLELPLDSAPVTIVTGMNQGCVPATRTYDAMLPGALRSKLKMPDRAARLARETYLLTLLSETRERLVLIAGKRTLRGDPLLPSPLLFRSPKLAVPELVLRYTGKRAHRPTVRAASVLRPGAVDRFEMPPIVRPATVEEMSVTSFRTYLASPYLFYLKHVLGLGEADDSAVELDPLAFGSLVHKVLEDFGRSDVKTSSDAEEIGQFVGDALADRARRAYGAEPGMAVRLQLNFAQWRLERFAAWQAQRRAAGWRIDREPEWRPAGQAVEFAAGDVSIRLRGKIDRIDRHEDTGQLAILDYKTSEDPQTPQRAHTFKGAWCDLQLPLYRHLAAELLQGEEPVLGYVCVSSAAHGTDLKEAEWDAADLADADATAREVVRAVKAGEFDEVNELDYEDGSLAAICRLARLAQAQRDEDGAVVKNGGTP